MTQFVDYKTEPSTATAYPSRSIWHDCDATKILNDPGYGYLFYDDFDYVNEVTAGVGDGLGRYEYYGDTGVTVTALAGEAAGVLEVGGNDADNDESVITTFSPFFEIDSSAPKQSWFEARVKKASIANNACAMFIGLGWDEGDDVSLAKTLCLTDDDAALGAFSFIGFHVDQADGDAMDFVYKAEGQSAVVKIAGVHVPVADTYVKVGFRYNPAAPAAKRIAVFVNGAEQNTYVTQTNIETATFPDGERLSPVWCVKVGAASESKAQMDWWRAAVRR